MTIEQELLDAVRELIATQRTANVPRLWSCEDVAAYLSLEPDTVARKVVTRSGFPKPICPTGSRRTGKRWFTAEVVEWCESQRGKLPEGRKRAA